MKAVEKLKPFAFIAMALLIMLAPACRKDKDNDNDTSAAQNENKAEAYFNELNNIADQVGTTGDLSALKVSEDAGLLLAACATITIDTAANPSAATPNVYTIDFGRGCTGNDGKTREGQIVVTATGPYLSAGTVITITPQGYKVNGNEIQGFRRVTNLGENSSGQPTFSVEVDGTVILANNGGTIEWTANRTRTWLSGYNTPLLFLDDEYGLTGNSSGTRVNGVTWTSVINTQLVYRHSCRQIVSGTMAISPENRPDRLLDFGAGDCDYSATVTINGNTYTFTTL
jgi:hypothetical protein